MHISTLTIAMMIACILIGIAMPVGMYLYLHRRFRCSMVPFWVGCATFTIFAMVLEAMVHRIVLLSAAGAAIQSSTILYALYGGVMAGLFEETGRLAAMKLLKKKHDRPETSLIYGAGHGCIEVILVMVVTMINYLVYAIMLNNGTLYQMLNAVDAQQREALTAVLDSLANSSPFLLLYSPLERVSAVILHISLSVLVWKSLSGKKGLFFLAIVLHAAMDAIAVVLGRMGLPAFAVEAAILLFAVGTAMFAGKVYRKL